MKNTKYHIPIFPFAVLLIIAVAFLIVKKAGSQYSGNNLKERLNSLEGDFAHYNDAIPCLTCHVLNNAPGDQLTAVAGNANLCMSCHNPVGMASSTPFSDADRAEPGVSGTSHAWNKPIVNADYGANFPSDPKMAEKVMYDEIVCSTCHNPHVSTYSPFLRTSNNQDAMCKDCHSVRNVGTYQDDPNNKGSHPVGKTYPTTDSRFYAAPQNPDIILIGGQVECSSCHGIHYTTSGGANGGTGDGYLLRTTNDNNLCTTCHTYTGHQGASCKQCHQTHNPNLTNIYMTKDEVQTTNSGLKPVLFITETGPNSFADGDNTYDGICEVCHTTTKYHRNNSSGNHVHNLNINCVACHSHADEFVAQGGCISCHSYNQDNLDGVPVGGRRAIVAEFPASNAHAHYGGNLDNSDCVVCHSMSGHKNGYVKLIDPDDGSILTFLKPDSLHTDPDVSNFCMGCHDADGAQFLTNPFDPFGNGNTPPDVATRFLGTLQWNEWYGDVCFGNEGTMRGVNSHHDISDADQAFSGAKLECLNCHGSHTSSASTPLIDPFNATTVWSGTGNGFCLSCHNGGTGPDNPGFPANVKGPTIALRGLESCNYTSTPWYVDYTWTNAAHGVDTKRDWPGYSGAPDYEVLCNDCHDPHGSYTTSNTVGNPYMIRDYVDGTAYVDDGVRPGPQWTGPPWDTYGTSRAVKITISGTIVDWGGSEGLCNVCHADWLDAYSWHSYCNGCQTCHGHGAAWQNNDWAGGGNSVPCGSTFAGKVLDSLQWENPTIFHLNQK
ncbi:MAG: hypothetical protein GXO86_07665 [Chlorobi bacterium]|nr:hypothetical protein [Chlorobiota bacterium]